MYAEDLKRSEGSTQFLLILTSAEACLNAERVEYRRREHVRKLEQLQRAAEASEEKQREKEERLARLRAKVWTDLRGRFLVCESGQLKNAGIWDP